MTAFVASLVCLAIPAAPAGPPGELWMTAQPQGPAETALATAVERGPFAGATGAALELLRVSEAHPGTVVSGLARLAAGLTLLDTDRAAEALPLLRDRDVQLTALDDHAAYAVARALEATDDDAGAAAAYLAVADMPDTRLVCPALFRAAEALAASKQPDRAVAALNRAALACPAQEPRALMRAGEILEQAGDRAGAAQAYDALDRRHPGSAEARAVASRLTKLAGLLPAPAPAEQLQRDREAALALFAAGRYREAARRIELLIGDRRVVGEEADALRVRLARALLALHRARDAGRVLARIGADSALAGEAAYVLALTQTGERRLRALEAVADGRADSPWAEEALFDLGNNFQKDAEYERALPYYRRLLIEYPSGPRADRAAWYVGWGDLATGRLEEAAATLQTAARARPDSGYAPGFLYWTARALDALGRGEEARRLYGEVVARFQHSYYGTRALAALPSGFPIPTAEADPAAAPAGDIPEPQRTRLRQLLLIRRLGEARAELDGLEKTRTVLATQGFIDYQRGELRQAISAMRAAYPEYVSAAGARLPQSVWHILYPLPFQESLQRKARSRDLDPALVAALIWQESTFDPQAVSRAGARGLMQIMPSTGRTLARQLGVRYRSSALLDPDVSLEFGTHYVREMLDLFDGRPERALAAYNAGPRRVAAWTAARPELDAEQFIESIPFTETRTYVKVILGNREQYRRIYGLEAPGSAENGQAGR